ncbi:MAG: polyprenyl synthetase family protein, partial [Lachnospira sp.]|nr:polyprenyl synthetase family protein [Lachnospira sp.]
MEFNIALYEKVKVINDTINSLLPVPDGKQSIVTEAMNYSIDVGGKRIRPLIISEVYKLLGGKDESYIAPFVTAMECIHTYSLVHDDLPAMDNDDFRRGQLTTHKKYGEDFGILAGDGLLNYAYEIMLESCVKAQSSEERLRAAKAASILARKAGVYGMVGGQALDVYLTGKTMTPDDLAFIFDLKTGALIEAAFMMGAVLAGVSDDVISKMEKVGNLVGVAFQIQDDILDVIGDAQVTGKGVNRDAKNNKTTYV